MAKRRKAGEGSIRLRKDGRWEGRVVVGYDEKGLPITKNVLAKTKGECVEKLNALKAALAPAMPKQVEPDMAFGAWLNLWLENRAGPTLRPSTRRRYRQLIGNQIVPELGNLPLRDLSRVQLQQFYQHLKTSGRKTQVEKYGHGLSDQTVRNCHSLCRAALEQAVREGLISKNPARLCQLPPSRPKEMRVLDTESFQRLLIQAKEEGYYELFLLELSTGLREGELAALRWEDLDFQTGALRVGRQVYRVDGQLAFSLPKTKTSGRVVVLPPPVLKVLQEYRKQDNSNWIFPSPVKEDSPLDPATIRKRLGLILQHADCQHVRFHDLRHTFATMSLEHGMDVKTLSTILGHVSASTTLNVYVHATDEMRRSAAAKIDQGIAGQPPQETPQPKKPTKSTFQAKKGKYRKPGTGCISQLNDHLWEGRYSPQINGKRLTRTVYAYSEVECEEKLAQLIREMKAEIAAEKERQTEREKAS